MLGGTPQYLCWLQSPAAGLQVGEKTHKLTHIPCQKRYVPCQVMLQKELTCSSSGAMLALLENCPAGSDRSLHLHPCCRQPLLTLLTPPCCLTHLAVNCIKLLEPVAKGNDLRGTHKRERCMQHQHRTWSAMEGTEVISTEVAAGQHSFSSHLSLHFSHVLPPPPVPQGVYAAIIALMSG